jgi:hypothetical protein
VTARAAFLRALPAHGFAPPAADVAAVEGCATPAGDAADRFAAEVRAFAAGFWSLTPTDRAAKWRELSARPVGPAAAWLAELAPGLDAIRVPQRDPAAAEVAAFARELFVLPPRERAARRVEWLTTGAADFRRRKAVGRVAVRTDPWLARLEPRLFRYLESCTTPARVELQTWVEAENRVRARRWWADLAASLAGYGAGGVFLFTLVFGAYQMYVMPREPAAAPEPPPRTRPVHHEFTAEQVRAFRDYDRGPRTSGPPAWYWLWVDRGRPAGRE